MKIRYLLFAALIVITMFGCENDKAPEEYTIDFEDGTMGGLVVTEGDWRITTVNDNKVAESYGSANSAHLSYTVPLGTDFTQTLKFYVNSMSQQTAPSMAFFSSGQVVNINIGDGLVKITAGDPSNPDSQGNYTIATGQWYTLEVSVRNGSVFTVKINGTAVVSHTYAQQRSYNKISYWTYPIISSIYIDDIYILTE